MHELRGSKLKPYHQGLRGSLTPKIKNFLIMLFTIGGECGNKGLRTHD